MFESSYKNTAVNALKQEIEEYNQAVKSAAGEAESLQECREKSVQLLKEVQEYVSGLAGSPREYGIKIGSVNTQVRQFERMQLKLEEDSRKAEKNGGKMIGTGIAVGSLVASVGPSAAMAVAMTFGTASTGTAIATLSGAAATNAALAWLGGGAVAAGAGGIAAGEAVLAMMAPIGWAVAGTALVGGTIYVSLKNRKTAEHAEKSIKEIQLQTSRIRGTEKRISDLRDVTIQLNTETERTLKSLKRGFIQNYALFSTKRKAKLMKLVNLAETLSVKIGEVIDPNKP